MDKYEYKLKTEQMLELMEDGAYGKAAAIADTIDWRRVRNTTMLANVRDRKSTRLNSSHITRSRMPSSA